LIDLNSLYRQQLPKAPLADMNQKREYVFKILVIGESNTGKTALVKLYVHNTFSLNYRATVGFFKN
jgi:GTPase SAR1 family protein